MRISALFASAIATAVLLSGCTRDPNVNSVGIRGDTSVSNGRWIIDRQIDRITGKPISYVSLRATRTDTDRQNNLIFVGRNLLLELTCFRDLPTARFAFNEFIGANSNSTLGWRFDDKPGKEVEARILRDNRTLIVDQPAEMRLFVDQLANSKTLYIRVVSLNDARNSAEFNVEGGAEAAKAAFANCPFPEPEPEPPLRAKKRKRAPAV